MDQSGSRDIIKPSQINRRYRKSVETTLKSGGHQSHLQAAAQASMAGCIINQVSRWQYLPVKAKCNKHRCRYEGEKLEMK